MFGWVKKKVGGATDFLVGGKKIDEYQKVAPVSEEEKKRQGAIEELIKAEYGQQGAPSADVSFDPKDQAIQDLFREQLMTFMTGSKTSKPTPEQMAEATAFVDQTFTAPMQEVMRNQSADYESAAQAKAQALGRNANLDIATQQAIYGENMRNQNAITAERGSRIAQEGVRRNEGDFNRGLQGLQAGMNGTQLGFQNQQAKMQRSGFLNDLAQRAFNNRMGLLNARSSLNDYMQRDRHGNITKGGGGTTSGLLTNINSIQNAFSDVAIGGSNVRDTATKMYGSGGTTYAANQSPNAGGSGMYQQPTLGNFNFGGSGGGAAGGGAPSTPPSFGFM